jgi:hypothetical protein
MCVPAPFLSPPALFSDKFEAAKQWGATDCVNPKDYDKPIQQVGGKPGLGGCLGWGWGIGGQLGLLQVNDAGPGCLRLAALLLVSEPLAAGSLPSAVLPLAPQVLVEMSPTGWGIDYTFECIGSVEVRGGFPGRLLECIGEAIL